MIRRLTAAATVALLSAGAVFPGKPPSDPFFLPGDPRGGTAVLSGSTWTEEGPDFAIRLQQIDDDERLAYIEHTTGLTIDPFAAPPGKMRRFVSYILEIENKSDGMISFNPQTCWLVSDRKRDLQAPFGLNDLNFAYSVAGKNLPPAYRRVAPALLEHGTTIAPGVSISGLLIYKALHPKTKWLHVDAVISLPTGDIVRFSAPYRRQTAKSRKR